MAFYYIYNQPHSLVPRRSNGAVSHLCIFHCRSHDCLPLSSPIDINRSWFSRLWSSLDVRCKFETAQFTLQVRCVCFSPDSSLLVCGLWDKSIAVWNVLSRTCLRTLNRHQAEVNTVSFSPDGKFLASASSDQSIVVWDPQIWEPVNTLKGHTNWVTSVHFNADSKMLASGSGDGAVKLWNIPSGRELSSSKRHQKAVSRYLRGRHVRVL